MDAKEIKLHLKRAREAIKEKEFKTVLEHCKAILNSDKNNYNAWVFVGVAAQETEEFAHAEEAFEKAIEIAPDQLLAWQGICNFYEKQENDIKLFDSMYKLVQLTEKANAKQTEMIAKLKDLSKKVKDKKKIVQVLKLQLSLNDGELDTEIWKDLFYELCEQRDGTSEDDNLLITALGKIVEGPSFSKEEGEKVIASCMAPLYKEGLIDRLMMLIEILSSNEIGGKLCVGFLLHVSITSYMKDDKVAIDLANVQAIADKYDTNDSTCHLLKGFRSFMAKQYVNALDELKLGLAEKLDHLEGLYLLTKVQLFLHLNKDAEETAALGLAAAAKSCEHSNTIGKFYLFLAEAQAGSQKWEMAFKSYEKCVEHLGRTAEVIKSFCFSLLEVGHVKEAQKLYAEFHGLCDDPAQLLLFEGYIHLLNGNYSAALHKLRTQISHGESPFSLHLIGQILWKTEEYEKAGKIFSKAAVMDPYFSRNFLFLGHYYMKGSTDKRKARQCYQKAFDLNPLDDESGKALSSILKSLGENESYEALLKKITQENSIGSSKWAWTQLGLWQLESGLLSDAIFSLQNAIRSDPRNSYCWQCLGDAYLKRGSFESALKAFERSSELNSSHMYPLYQVSTIQKLRELFDDAVIRYRKLLELVPTYIPALIGLAETLLLLGKQYFEQCLFGRAKDCFQETLNVLASAVHTGSSFWKLAGDACTYASYLAEKWLPLVIPPEFHAGSASTKWDLLRIGAKFYGSALSLNENLSNLWHDLGINCYLQSAQAEMKLDFTKKAFICLQKAVSLAPNNHEHWNALGIVAAGTELKDYALAQHAFIKAIQLESNNVEAWSNLGILYLENKNIDLAHRAFKVAQSLDPSFQRCWIGQAMIADIVKHNETMDLYRHAAGLGSHVEAFLGYGRSVCQAILDPSSRNTELYKYNIEQMGAIVVASDCLVKCIANSTIAPEALNHLGMLLERQKLYSGALTAYKRGLDLCEDVDKIEDHRVNYARLLSVTGRNMEAITEFTKLRKVDVSLLCSFGQVLYRNKEFKKAHQVFNRALETCKDPAVKSHILVAMAMSLFKLPAPEKNEALNFLLQSSQLEPPSVNGLLALWALNLLSKNTSGIAAIKDSLAPFSQHPEYSTSICMLDATQSFIQTGARAARTKLLSAIHREPNNATNWMQAAFSLLHWSPEFAEQASRCSQIAVSHNGNKALASQIFALCRLAVGYKKVSLVAAQKAVHIQPDQLSNWITLTAACHVVNKDRKHVGWIFNFVKTLGKKQGIKTDVLGWLICMEVVHYLFCKDLNSASKLIKQAISVQSFSSQTLSTLHILNAFVEMLETSKLDNLVLAVTSNSSNLLGWQILIKYLLQKEKFVEVEKTLQQFLIASLRHFPKLKLYPLLQLVTLAYQAMRISDDKEKWMKLGEDAVSEAVKTFPGNQAARFLQGLFALELGNSNLARRSFERVLFVCSIKEPKWMEGAALRLLLPIHEERKDVDALQRLFEHYPLDEKVKLAWMKVTNGKN